MGSYESTSYIHIENIDPNHCVIQCLAVLWYRTDLSLLAWVVFHECWHTNAYTFVNFMLTSQFTWLCKGLYKCLCKYGVLSDHKYVKNVHKLLLCMYIVYTRLVKLNRLERMAVRKWIGEFTIMRECVTILVAKQLKGRAKGDLKSSLKFTVELAATPCLLARRSCGNRFTCTDFTRAVGGPSTSIFTRLVV